MSNGSLYLLGGVARSGKDSFATLLIEHLTSIGRSVSRHAFADALKRELEPEIRAKYGLSVWSQVSAEKDVFRARLVEWGSYRRAQTNGTYWVKQIEDVVKVGLKNGIDQIITDCRHATSDVDEAGWGHSLGGKLIYVERVLPDGSILGPANPTEALNDELLRRASDIIVTIPTFEDCHLARTRPYVLDVWTRLTQPIS